MNHDISEEIIDIFRYIISKNPVKPSDDPIETALIHAVQLSQFLLSQVQELQKENKEMANLLSNGYVQAKID